MDQVLGRNRLRDMLVGSLYQYVKAANNRGLGVAADVSVTKALSEEEKLNYLECLLKVVKATSQEKTSFAVCLTTSKASPLKARFQNVMAPPKTSPLFHVIPLLFIVILFLSTFVVFEPYYIPDDIQSETFILTKEVTYLVLREDQGYDLYVDGTCMGMMPSIPEDLSMLPIIENLREAEP